MNTVDKEQSTEINIAKGILMTLVILGHAVLNSQLGDTVGGSSVMKFICVFHMPAFFLISGLLINKDNYRAKPFKEFLKQKVQRVLIPYLFFETVGGLLNVFLLQQTLGKTIIKTISLECNIGADWYLVTYFFAVLLYYLYTRIETRPLSIIIIIVIFVGKMIVPEEYAEDRLLIDLFRILIGFSLLVLGDQLRWFLLREKKLWEVIVSVVVVVICARLNKTILWVDLWSATIGNPFYFLIGGVAGTTMIIELSRLISSKSLAWIGVNTIPILGTHQMILNAMYITYSYWFSAVVYLIASMIVVFIMEIIIVKFLNAFMPSLIGAKTIVSKKRKMTS